MPYFDSGQFKLHFFNNENPEVDSLDSINGFLKIHDHKKQNSSKSVVKIHYGKECHQITKKSINVVFKLKDTVFVNIFDHENSLNWSFKYNYMLKKYLGEPIKFSLDR